MNKYKIGKYIVKANSIYDAVTIVKTIKDSVGSDLREYQKWVDYDMKKYGKISEETRSKIEKAGLEIIKSGYGDYEVIARDSLKKDSVTVRDIIQSLVDEETSAVSSYNVALETLKDHIPVEAYEAIKAIRDDEQTHIENLYAVLNGNITPKNLEN